MTTMLEVGPLYAALPIAMPMLRANYAEVARPLSYLLKKMWAGVGIPNMLMLFKQSSSISWLI